MADDEHDGDNRTADMKIDDTILKLAEQYVGYERRAKQLNKDKAGVREQADKIGIPSLAWQMGVRMVKIMDTSDRRDFERGFKRVANVLDKNGTTLFAEEIAAREKRKSKATEKATKEKAKAAAAKAKSIEAGDDNPRSNPASGGAGKKRGRPSKAELTASAAAAANQAAEQAEGGDVLDGAIDGIKSQSQLAREKLDKLGLN
jgi:hypothetical protein